MDRNQVIKHLFQSCFTYYNQKLLHSKHTPRDGKFFITEWSILTHGFLGNSKGVKCIHICWTIYYKHCQHVKILSEMEEQNSETHSE